MRVKCRTAASAYFASNLSFNIWLMVLGIQNAFPPRQDNVDSALGRIHPSVVFSSRRVSQIKLAAEERLHPVPLLLYIARKYFFLPISLRQIRNEQGELLRTTQILAFFLNEGTNWS